MPKKTPYDERYILSSVNHSLKILEIMMVREYIDINELSRLTGYNKSSIFKMLYSLQYRGFVEKSGYGTYRLGEKLKNFSHVVENRQRLVDLSSDTISSLFYKTNENITLAQIDGEKIVFLAVKMAKDQGNIKGRIGATLDMYTNSAGKILLSRMKKKQRNALIDELEFKKICVNTVTDKEEFKKQIDDLSKERYAICYQEAALDGADISAPLYDKDGSCIASINLVFNIEKNKNRIQYLIDTLLEETDRLNAKLSSIAL